MSKHIQYRVTTQHDMGGVSYAYFNVEAKDINDGFVLAAVRAHALSSSTTDTELVSIEFWQVLPDRQPPAVVVGDDTIEGWDEHDDHHCISGSNYDEHARRYEAHCCCGLKFVGNSLIGNTLDDVLAACREHITSTVTTKA